MTAMPAIIDRSTWQEQLDALPVRQKEHTREGDAIAAARRLLPMVEVDAATPIVGPEGRVTLLDVFAGRSQLIAYYFMWHTGHSAAEQCERCTWAWENSPSGWPIRPIANNSERVRSNGRPIAQWSRLEAGRSDNLS